MTDNERRLLEAGDVLGGCGRLSLLGMRGGERCQRLRGAPIAGGILKPCWPRARRWGLSMVKRFDLIAKCGSDDACCDIAMKIRKYGEFVLYEDYAKLESEVYPLRQQAKAWEAGTQYGGLVSELEAENVRLYAALEKRFPPPPPPRKLTTVERFLWRYFGITVSRK